MLQVPVCSACGLAVFPPRALCPRCGARDWRMAAAGAGEVLGLTSRDGIGIAAVRTELGPVVIARLEGSGDGPVTLSEDEGVPVARSA